MEITDVLKLIPTVTGSIAVAIGLWAVVTGKGVVTKGHHTEVVDILLKDNEKLQGTIKADNETLAKLVDILPKIQSQNDIILSRGGRR